MAYGGCALVSYRPDWLPESVLTRLDHYILTAIGDPEPQQAARQTFNIPSEVSLSDIPAQHVLLNGERLVRLRQSARRVQHIRHLYKYLDMPLPGTSASTSATSRIFLVWKLPACSSLRRSSRRCGEQPDVPPAAGRFSAWVRARWAMQCWLSRLPSLSRRTLSGETLRDALLKQLATRYAEINAMP